jgi:hypothetical protein
VGTLLHAVEGDLHHEHGLDVHHVPFVSQGELLELLRLPGEGLVGEPLEGLAEHDEVAGRRVARAEVEIAEPAAAPSAAPLRGEHHEIEGVGRLQLQPLGPAAPRLVGRVEGLCHHALVTGGERLGEEGLGSVGVGGDQALHEQIRRQPLRQRREALHAGPLRHVLPVEVQQVEEAARERQLAAQLRDVEPAPEAAHRLLEGQGTPILAQREGLAVEHEGSHRQRRDRLHQLRHGGGHVVPTPREDAHFVCLPVQLHARAVELELEGRAR